MSGIKNISTEEQSALLQLLEARFNQNPNRHPGIEWPKVKAKIEADAHKINALHQMEQTGGEPDVVGFDAQTREYIFYDCAPESPKERRSLCYDKQALHARKEHKPRGSAIETAASMGIELLTEAQYRELQQLGNFDLKTSSWVQTPADVRAHGGALFCDRRYDKVFVYHNGAESYYAARGFRGALKV